MARFPQAPCTKGSQRWLQWLINDAPELLDQQIGLGPVAWRSPLGADEYAEYRDQAFIDLLGISLPTRSLASFWPRGGPQWDALGRAASGEVILVEAKAHLTEMHSPASAASESSLAQIQASLAETARSLGVSAGAKWSQDFYQYANRLAHAYLLDRLNDVPTRLVFVYFIGDGDVRGPDTRAEWDAEIHKVHDALGLSVTPSFVTDVFLDVREFVTTT
jgi:hypothetical protein